ncbi:hypothetical protein K431DRAFT_234503 [Polychaeton citri CBS 116435]|uniref:Uncharacterized protein n=1 Tax=Polychaeton citri CBS 116435 TaxID=1314669 RepID=A0A9P4UKI8_9PEZI|nr:hypothetical protein K431DRAFT_234503 [Polychaeton citri CBS 116435]
MHHGFQPKQTGPKPIVRKPFPSPVKDRSLIFGVTNSLVLRTGFRIGEAHSVGARAIRLNQLVLIELYGRVTSSHREDFLPSLSSSAGGMPKPSLQRFVFKDLFHNRQPFLDGEFQLWNQSQLWDLDSRPFLRAGEGERSVMCRTVGRMKRDSHRWKLEVLNIWEATWEDVDFVAGIYAKE